MNEIKRAIKHLKERNFTSKQIEMAIEALERQLNNGWIPVSERLPNKMGIYECTVKYDDKSIGVKRVLFICPISSPKWLKENDLNVIAWRERPEPYKEGER